MKEGIDGEREGEGCRGRRGMREINKETGDEASSPQLCLWSSSLMSPQSLSPSQIHEEAMQRPSSQRNCSVLQVLSIVAGGVEGVMSH